MPLDLFGGAEAATMPAITLWQPWASLIFAGVKQHETRSFRYPARLEGQIIGIHAAAQFPAPKHISEDLNDLCYDLWGCGYNYSLPLGALLGTVRLVGCSPTDLSAGFQDRDNLIAGDWSSGRFAWALDDVTPYPEPIPAKGKQGWWRVPCDSGRHSQSRVPSGARAEGCQSGGAAASPEPQDDHA